MAYTIPDNTRIGHVHLKVSNLERSLGFYCDLLGFTLITTYGKDAAFISAGGYHHHIGLNTWYSKDANCNAFEDAIFQMLQLQTTIVIDASASKIQSVSFRCAIGMGGTVCSQGAFTTGMMGNGGAQLWQFHYTGGAFNYLGGTDVSYTASSTSLTLIAKKAISACNQVPYTYVELYTKQ